MSVSTGLPRGAWCGFESTNSGNFRKKIAFHQPNFGYECLLIKGQALRERGLGHFKLLLGHSLLVAEGHNGCAVGSFGRDSPFELVTQPGVGALKIGNAVLMVGDSALGLLFAVLQSRLKIVDYLHVFLNLAAQCCTGVSDITTAAIPAATITGRTTENIDVDILGSG